MKNGDIITAKKINVEETVVEEAFTDPKKRELTPKARVIFSEWYDKYSDKEIGKMTPESTTKFILGATLEECDADDGRIKGMFKDYAKKDPTGKTMEREEFLKFYYNAASSIS